MRDGNKGWIAVCAAVIVMLSPMAFAATIISDDFESHALGSNPGSPWSGVFESESGYINVTNSQASSGSQSLYFHDADPSWMPLLYDAYFGEDSKTNSSLLSFDFYLEDVIDNGSAYWIDHQSVLRIQLTSHTEAAKTNHVFAPLVDVALGVAKDGSVGITYLSENTKFWDVDMNTDEWFNLEIALDDPTDTSGTYSMTFTQGANVNTITNLPWNSATQTYGWYALKISQVDGTAVADGAADVYMDNVDWHTLGYEHEASTILSLSHVAGDIFEMVVDCPTPDTSYPKSTDDLVLGGWGSVGHSASSGGPFTTNSLGSVPGTNTIYMESDGNISFFGIGEE